MSAPARLASARLAGLRGPGRAGARLASAKRVGCRLAVAALGAVLMTACGSSTARSPTEKTTSTAVTGSVATPSVTTSPPTPGRGSRPRPHRRGGLKTRPDGPFAVGLRTIAFVDRGRTIRLPSGATVPRTLVTLIRYPTAGRPADRDLPDAPALHHPDGWPLVVFGHGFAVTPGPYAELLRAWARAGYVVAAPIFPLENANAPGGPDESDLVNQPDDMSFLVTRLTAAFDQRHGPLAGLVNPTEIAVSGQSDGGDTALAAAYDPRYRDRRIRAAAILSGAEIPGLGAFSFPTPGPPLLATQGTADTINPPASTAFFFEAAAAPKYLLALLGAAHIGPYTDQQPQLSIVERVTIAFFDRYLKGRASALRQMIGDGHVPGVAALQADP